MRGITDLLRRVARVASPVKRQANAAFDAVHRPEGPQGCFEGALGPEFRAPGGSGGLPNSWARSGADPSCLVAGQAGPSSNQRSYRRDSS